MWDRTPCCGNGCCDLAIGENTTTSSYYCAVDCPVAIPVCGDGKCDPGETAGEPYYCENDCWTCGTNGCEPLKGENCQTCEEDCKPCPACTHENGLTVCLNALPPEQQDCTIGYCDHKVCTYMDTDILTGKNCGPNKTAPYSDFCHVDVCIRGVCVLKAPIISADPTSAGGALAPINPDKPGIKGECLYDNATRDVYYQETIITPFCGNGVPEPPTETQANCCKDVGCPADYACTSSGACVSVLGPNLASLGSNWSGWVPWIVIAILIGYFLAAIVYMASHIIGSPELEAWAKNEIYEVSVSALFVGSAVFFVGLLATLSVALIGASYVDVADTYVHVLSADLIRVYGLLTKGIFAMGLLGYVGTQIPLPIVVTGVVNAGISGGLYPFGGFSLLTNTLVMYTNVVSFAIISVIGQKVMLDFILQAAFSVLLPFGLLLRSFTFTRKLGATLMAVAIGAYVVYPMTLVMNYQIYASVSPIPAKEFHSSKLPLDKFNAGEWADVFLGPDFGKYCVHWYDWIALCWLRAIIMWVVSFVVAIFHAVAFVMMVLAAVLTYGVAEVTASGFDYFAEMIPWAVQPVVAALMFPILDLIIVVTAMRSLSEAMGGESRITGLAEFI